jgi:hypothetical protein
VKFYALSVCFFPFSEQSQTRSEAAKRQIRWKPASDQTAMGYNQTALRAKQTALARKQTEEASKQTAHSKKQTAKPCERTELS